MRYDSSGVILSPGWPESYPNLQMCSWSITVEKGYNVTITFESFHTEREFDVLEIFDGKTDSTQHSQSWPQIVLSDTMFFKCLNLISSLCLSFFSSLTVFLSHCHDLRQVPRPTVPLWLRWAATCQRPLTSQLLGTSFWSAGLQTMAQIRRASKSVMLVSTKVCIPTLFYYYYLIWYCMEKRQT